MSEFDEKITHLREMLDNSYSAWHSYPRLTSAAEDVVKSWETCRSESGRL